eukprot:Filipodium_phascolosomae@DN1153_c0_g1_i1.p1
MLRKRVSAALSYGCRYLSTSGVEPATKVSPSIAFSASGGVEPPANASPAIVFNDDIDLLKNVGESGVRDALSSRRYKSLLYMFSLEEEAFNPAEICEANGVLFRHLPTNRSKLTYRLADKIATEVNSLPKPCLIQCERAVRAGCAAVMAQVQSNPGFTKKQLNRMESEKEVLYYNFPTFPPWVENYFLSHTLELQPTSAKSGLHVNQLRDAQSLTYTYIVACPISRAAIIVDPVVENVERDVKNINQSGLKLVAAVDTQLHADHVSSCPLLKKYFEGFEVCMSHNAGGLIHVDRFVGHDDRIYLGSRYLKVVETPGSSKSSISLIADNHSVAFTGDTLLARGCGRTDLPNNGNKGDLYDSVHNNLFSQSESTIVYPGHENQGQGCSSIGEEKRFNSYLAQRKPEFLKSMEEFERSVGPPVNAATIVEANTKGSCSLV